MPDSDERNEQLSLLREPLREGATSVPVQAALLYHYPLNYFLLPEAEGRGEREAPKRTFLSVLPYDAFLRNLRQEPGTSRAPAFRSEGSFSTTNH